MEINEKNVVNDPRDCPSYHDQLGYLAGPQDKGRNKNKKNGGKQKTNDIEKKHIGNDR